MAKMASGNYVPLHTMDDGKILGEFHKLGSRVPQYMSKGGSLVGIN